MRRVLGFVLATVPAMVLLALTASQALASHVQCGDVITQDTTLDADLTCSSGPALIIGADDVTLNLGGRTVRRADSDEFNEALNITDGGGCRDDSLLTVPLSDVTIENGTMAQGVLGMDCPSGLKIRGITFSRGAQIKLRDNEGTLIENNRFDGVTGSGGIRQFFTGDAVIRFNFFNGGTGIFTRGIARVLDNVIAGAESGVVFFKGGGEIAGNRIVGTRDAGVILSVASPAIHDNVITGNGTGITMGWSGGDEPIEHNVITRNSGDGITQGSATSKTIRGNLISRNGGNGVWIGGDPDQPLVSANLVANRIVGNGVDGIYMGQCLNSALVEGNTVDRNGDDGIEVVAGPATCYQFSDPPRPTSLPTVTGNHTWWNADLGIEAVPGTSGGGNWAKHNGNPLQCVPGSLCSTKGKPHQ